MKQFPTILVILLLFTVALRAQEPAAEPDAPKPNPEKAKIQKAIDSYVDSFNKADPKAVAAHWTAEGEFITPAGKALRGQKQLHEEFKAYFAETKNAKLELLGTAIDFLSPSVAVETGVARVIAAEAEPNDTEYEAIHVKTADGWKMDSVREQESIQTATHYEQLKQLEWMVGEWVDSDEHATIETVCRWTKNQNFLSRTFRVYVEDRIDLEGTQVIGWDPALQTIRSWVFDSEGGFGVGLWSHEGNQWTVRGLRVLPDGRRGSTTTVTQFVDENTFTLRTIGRQIDGELMPNIGPIKVVRK